MSNQTTSSPSQGFYNSATNHLWEMVRDKRPELEPQQSEADQKVIDQLEHLYALQTITSRPGSYYRGGDNQTLDFPIDPKNSKTQKTFHYKTHPIGDQLAERIEKLREIAGPDAYICGADLNRRSAITQWSESNIPDCSAYVVPAYGDVFCAYEMTAILQARLKGEDPHPERPIIIDNNADCWKHLIWDERATLPSDLNIHVFRETQQEWRKAQEILEKVKKPSKISIANTVEIPPNALILVATKTSEKIIELQDMFRGTGVRVMRLDHFANFQDPPEASRTYAGNAIEKITNARSALAKRAETHSDLLQENILSNCPDRQQPNVFILSEDSGMHLQDQRISKILQREDGLKREVKNELVLHHDQFPGPEFGPVINGALGEQGFWDKVNDVIKSHEYDPEPNGKDDLGPTLNRGVINASVLALTPFDIHNPKKNQPIYSFAGTNNNMLLKEPTSEQGEIAHTGHYLVPSSQSIAIPKTSERTHNGISIGSKQLSQAQLGPDYLGHHSARSFAVKSLRAMLGLDVGLTRPMPYHPIHIGVSNDQSAITYSTDYVTENSPLEQINFSNERWNTQAEALCANPDVYYLSPRRTHENIENQEAELFHDLFGFSSLIVSKQLIPRDKDKPIIVDQNDESWHPFIEIYDHLRHIGMANDQQNTFIKRFNSPEELNHILEQTAQNKFNGNYLTTHSYDEKNIDWLDKQPDNRFNVAMFCSASSKNHAFNESAKSLGAHLAGRGHGMVFGAADKEMMGSARIGYINAKPQGSKALLIGSSTEDILPIESENPQGVVDSLDVYHHAKHIYDRMQFMMKHSDAFAIYPGGVGTVQELMLLLCAKQAKHPDMKDKPIILYNYPLEINGQDRGGFYDPLIDMIGKKTLEKYGVHICSSEREVFEAIETAKQPTPKVSSGALTFAKIPHATAPLRQ